MISVEAMKQLEYRAVQEGTSIEDLMENAGRKVFEILAEKYDLDGKHIIIFAGHGNNGGDSFVTARHLAEAGHSVVVLFFGWQEKLSEAARINFQRIQHSTIIVPIETKQELEHFHVQKNDGLLLLDAILGTGVQGKIREPACWGIDLFNSLQGIKVAVDVPSGMNADTGEIEDKACDVELIVCFHDIKQGLVKMKEKVVVVNIGL